MPGADLASAIAAGILSIPHAGVSGADFSLDVPMAREAPLVAVGEAHACKGTLIAAVLCGGAQVEATYESPGEGKVDIRNI